MARKHYAVLATQLAMILIFHGPLRPAAAIEHAGGDDPTGACCSLEAPFLCSISTREACGAGFAGDGTTCEKRTCALCDPDLCDWCWVGHINEGNCPAEWDGDGVCDCGCQFADVDCPCGNGVCDPTENACTCPKDCPAACGDLCCSDDESRTNCTADCFDLRDTAAFWTCFSGPGVAPTLDCQPFDLDADSDIDLTDYALLARDRLGSP